MLMLTNSLHPCIHPFRYFFIHIFLLWSSEIHLLYSTPNPQSLREHTDITSASNPTSSHPLCLLGRHLSHKHTYVYTHLINMTTMLIFSSGKESRKETQHESRIMQLPRNGQTRDLLVLLVFVLFVLSQKRIYRINGICHFGVILVNELITVLNMKYFDDFMNHFFIFFKDSEVHFVRFFSCQHESRVFFSPVTVEVAFLFVCFLVNDKTKHRWMSSPILSNN